MDAHPVPDAHLCQSAVEHRHRERPDQPGVLGERDEHVGADEPAPRVVPAHERLDAGDETGADRGLRLVVDDELALLERAAQLAGERQPRGAVGLLRAVVGLDAGAPALGDVHGDVGAAQERVDVAAVVGRDRHADARLGAHDDPVDVDRLRDVPAQRLRKADRLHRVGDAREDDRELVAAEAGYRVARARRRGDALGDLAQEQVAVQVPERVVDLLEVVEIDQQHRDLVAAGDTVGQRLVDALAQQVTVRQTRERVVQRAVLELDRLARRPVHAVERQHQRRDQQRAEARREHGDRRQPDREARARRHERDVAAHERDDLEPPRKRDHGRDQHAVEREEEEGRERHARQLGGDERLDGADGNTAEHREDDRRAGHRQDVLRRVEPHPRGRLAGVHVGRDARDREHHARGERAGVQQDGERERGRERQLALDVAPEDADPDELAEERERREADQRDIDAVRKVVALEQGEQRHRREARERDDDDVAP